jgi:hypothetical protein
MPSLWIVEAFDVVEHFGLRFVQRSIQLAGCTLGLQRREEASIAALSQTFPDRLIEQTTPWSAISRWNCSLVYWADSTDQFARNSS